MKIKVALGRVNYSQLYGFYDKGKTLEKRDILTPYQLLTLAGYIQSEDVEVKIFDGEVELLNQRDLSEKIMSWNPNIVGLTATTPDTNLAIEVFNYIKIKNNTIKTVIGGPQASARPDDLRKHKSIDYIVVGDGEYPLTRIIEHEIGHKLEKADTNVRDKYFSQINLNKGESNNPVIIRGYPESLTGLPMPAHNLLDYSNYQFTDPTRGAVIAASIMSSRGCPFNCAYCFHDRNLRNRSIDLFIDEIVYLAKRKNVKYFYIYDDTFTVNKRRVLEILDRIISLELNECNFQCLTRAELLDEELARKMKRANFMRVSMGVESGSEKILKAISKGTEKEDYIKACKLLLKYGVETRGSFMLGLPFETKETVEETIEFSKELELYHANFNIMMPYPGTKIYEMALQGRGIYFVDPKYATDWDRFRRWGTAVTRTNDLSSKEIVASQKKAQVEFYTQKKVYDHHEDSFLKGNRSRFFYRPLNFAWKQKYGKNIPFWNELGSDQMVSGVNSTG